MLELTAQDRCDRCGARAMHRATKPGIELLLCTHHKNEHHDALIADYWLIDTDELVTA